MIICPKCRSSRIHRVPARGAMERVRQTLTYQRPHLCEACGWRGWGPRTDTSIATRTDWLDDEAVRSATASRAPRPRAR